MYKVEYKETHKGDAKTVYTMHAVDSISDALIDFTLESLMTQRPPRLYDDAERARVNFRRQIKERLRVISIVTVEGTLL